MHQPYLGVITSIKVGFWIQFFFSFMFIYFYIFNHRSFETQVAFWLVSKILLSLRLCVCQTRNLEAYYILFVVASQPSMKLEKRNLGSTCSTSFTPFSLDIFSYLAFLIHLAFLIYSIELLFLTSMISSGLLCW